MSIPMSIPNLPSAVTAQDTDAPLETYEIPGSLPASAHNAAMGPEAFTDFFSMMQRVLSAPGYEYDGPFPVGGIDGTYHFGNNGDTQCEVMLAFVSFLGGAGFYAVNENEPILPTVTSAYGIDPYTSKRGWVVVSDSAKTIPLMQMWTPMQPLGQLGIVVAASGKAVIGHFYTRRRVLPGGQAAQSIR